MIRVAVVGCGYWGPNVIRNFSSSKNCQLTCICDKDSARLAAIHERYPAVRAVTDFKQVLNDKQIDAVAICTPVQSHYPIASAALNKGKHVMVEKPLSHSVESAQELVGIAEKNKLTLLVDHTFLYSGAVQKIKEIIKSGEMGELLYFDSVRINLGLFQSDVNVIWDLAPHDLSIMAHLIGKLPRWISAVGCTHYGQHENMAYLTMKFDGSLIAHLHINWLAPVKLRSTLIGGSKRMIVYDDIEPSEKIPVYEKRVSQNGSRPGRHAALVDYRIGDMHAPYVDKTEPLESVCNDFLTSIQNSSDPLSSGHTGLQVVRILECAQRSVESNGERVNI